MEDLGVIQHFVSAAMQSQMAQFAAAFGLAAFIHSGQVRKEIRAQMMSVTDAFNNLAEALKKDLANQAKRIGNMEEGMDSLKSRVKELETK